MTKRCMKAVFSIACPPGSGEDCDEFLKDLYHVMPLIPVLMIRFLFWIFYCLPFLIIFRFKTVANLGDDDQARYILWWEKNRFYFIREAFNAIKTVSLLARVGNDWEP